MNIDEVQMNLSNLYDKASAIYKEEAEAEIEYRAIEKDEDIQLAVIQMQFDDGKVAKNKLELMAYSDPLWKEYQEGLQLLKAEWLKKKANVKAFEAKLAILRSLNKQIEIL